MYGIYVHVPFCLRKCPYCDFYSVREDGDLRQSYLGALLNQIRSFPSVSADTIYLGGGTPSLLEPEEIRSILETIREHHSVSADAEISMECNPATADREKLKGFLGAGINRLSVGCQSFDDHILKRLGRLHDSSQAKETLRLAREAGFKNVSADLMLAVPDQTPEIAAEDARTAVSLGVDHVSAYLLKICEGTPFAEGVEGVPDDDVSAACYEAFSEVLLSAGYERYEISNFARPGFESRHNLKYWDCGRWLGLGPAAHMSDGKRRYSSPPDLRSFIEAYKDGPVPDPLSLMCFEGEVDGEEYILTSLRTARGLDTERLWQEYGIRFSEEKQGFIRRLCDAGLASFDGRHLALTGSGFMVSNSILSELI